MVLIHESINVWYEIALLCTEWIWYDTPQFLQFSYWNLECSGSLVLQLHVCLLGFVIIVLFLVFFLFFFRFWFSFVYIFVWLLVYDFFLQFLHNCVVPVYPSGAAHELTIAFQWDRVAQSLVFCVVFCR